MIKTLTINGSPRPEGNTAFLIQRVFLELEKEGITESIDAVPFQRFFLH
jgi:multimeric flavodoxin WrbA